MSNEPPSPPPAASLPSPPGRPLAPGPRLEIPATLEALYANIVRITHSPSEIVLDFAQMLPDKPVGTVKARMLMSPLGAKLFHKALGENLARYEQAFGEIPIPGDTSLASQLFRPTKPPSPET